MEKRRTRLLIFTGKLPAASKCCQVLIVLRWALWRHGAMLANLAPDFNSRPTATSVDLAKKIREHDTELCREGSLTRLKFLLSPDAISMTETAAILNMSSL